MQATLQLSEWNYLWHPIAEFAKFVYLNKTIERVLPVKLNEILTDLKDL